MPWNRKDYPLDWEAVRAAVLARAGNRCEAQCKDGLRCAARNGVRYHRCLDNPEYLEACAVQDPDDICLGRDVDEVFSYPAQEDPVRVVLTTAHTCQCEPKCGILDHLLSLCQLHHLRLDAQQHGHNAARTRRRKLVAAGQGILGDDCDPFSVVTKERR